MKAGNKFFALYILLLTAFSLCAQREDGKYPVNYNQEYIEDYRHRFNFSLAADLKNTTINALTADRKLLNYQSNLPIPTYGFMLSYRWLNVVLTFPVNGMSYLEEDRGETKNYSFGVGMIKRQWFFRSLIDHYIGYYLRNPQVLDPDYFSTHSKYPVYPDMNSTTFLFNVYHGFNGNKFSYQGMLWQSELQKRSAGTFLLGSNLGFRFIESDEPIVVLTGDIGNVYEMRYGLASLSFGYAHTWVPVKNLNISFMAMPGFSYFVGRYFGSSGEKPPFGDTFGMSAELRFQIYYQLGNFYTGATYSGFAIANWIDKNSPTGGTQNYARVNLGYRFKVKPIKWLKPFGLSN